MIDMGWVTFGLLGLLPLVGLALTAGAGDGAGDAGGDKGGQGEGDDAKKPDPPTPPAPIHVSLTEEQRAKLLAGDGTLDLTQEQYTGGVRQQMDTLRRRATGAEKRLSDIATAQEETERKNLMEQERYKELYEKESQARQTVEAARKDDLIRSRVLLAAMKSGAVDPDAAFTLAKGLASFGSVQISDEGAVSGVDELIEALKTEKPYLFSSQDPKPKQSVGAPSNPGPSDPPAPKNLAEAGDAFEAALRAGI